MDKQRYLFAYDYGTGAVWYYFFAHAPDDVRRKYPVLMLVNDRPAWLTSDVERRLLQERTFDVDDDPSTAPSLKILERESNAYRARLGEQVLPPR